MVTVTCLAVSSKTLSSCWSRSGSRCKGVSTDRMPSRRMSRSRKWRWGVNVARMVKPTLDRCRDGRPGVGPMLAGCSLLPGKLVNKSYSCGRTSKQHNICTCLQCLHIESGTKESTYERNFQLRFLKWKLCLNLNFTHLSSQCSKLWSVKKLALIMAWRRIGDRQWHWTNSEPVPWSLYASSGLNVLFIFLQFNFCLNFNDSTALNYELDLCMYCFTAWLLPSIYFIS